MTELWCAKIPTPNSNHWLLGDLKMNRRKALNILAGTAAASITGLHVSLGFAHSHGGHHAAHHHHQKAHVHHSGRKHQHSEKHYDSHYHHTHDDYDEHHHDCRFNGEVDAQTGHHKQECREHDGGWKYE